MRSQLLSTIRATPIVGQQGTGLQGFAGVAAGVENVAVDLEDWRVEAGGQGGPWEAVEGCGRLDAQVVDVLG
jgi:hypothetical protein